ncbi:MAG: hypothetical protein ABF743_13185 [Schleiferilactobacillus perolens]|uniref:hypothetical protein n=1 Tax=Schleiferilactobacillus perolens TaxID=100468 RepID=UPI0039E7E114
MNFFRRKKEPLSDDTDTTQATTPNTIMATSRWLRFFDLFRGLIGRRGVDYDQFRLILGYKLYMDAADPEFMNTLNNNSKRREGHNAFFAGLWVYALISLFMCTFVFMFPGNRVFGLGYALLFYSMMYLTVLVQAFSGSLLDVRDVGILETRGVTEQTRSAAQTAHIMVYVFSLFVAMMAAPIISSFIATGIVSGVVFTISALLLMIVNYVFSIVLYAVILHFFHGERLKNILSMIQIVIMILSIIMYQLPQLLTSASASFSSMNKPMSFNWVMAVVYPFWFTGPNEWLRSGQFNAGGILSVLMLITVVVAYFAFNPAMRRLTNNLSKLTESGSEPAPTGWYFRLWRKLIPQRDHQKAFFTLSWRMMQSDGDYKMRVYPSMVMGFVFMIIPLMNAIQEPGNFWTTLRSNWVWNMLPAFSVMGLPIAIYYLRFTKNPNALNVFANVPNFDKAVMYREAIRTVLVRLSLPVVLVLGIVTILVTNPLKGIGTMVAGLGISAFVVVINGQLFQGTTPYGTIFQTGQVNSGAMIGGYMLSIAIAGIGGGLSAVAPWWAAIIAGIILFGGSWVWLNHAFSHPTFRLPGEPGGD